MAATKSNHFKLQRTISLIAFIIGITVSIINFINYSKTLAFNEIIIQPGFYWVFIISLGTLITIFVDNTACRILQVGLAFLMGAASIYDVYNSIHGLGVVIIAVFLSFKYGFFKKRTILKSIIVIITVFSLVIISAKIDFASGHLMYGLDAVLYLLFFLFISYLIYQDEIKAYIRRTNEAEIQSASLTAERDQLQKRITELNKKLKPANLDAMGVTPAEKRVIEVLVVYREEEKEIAARLGLSYYTVNNHFRHIRDKLGVDKREDIIEICRNNFS